MKTNRIKAPH